MTDRIQAALADRYSFERELGRGGMATVWLARDIRHDRLVALKVLHAELAGAMGVDRFVREVRLTARLQHPNVAPLLDSGILQGEAGASQPWFAMPYLAGESLRARLEREQQLPVEDALAITEAVAGALQAAHGLGIVHRDIKPENVLLSEGWVWVVDFGIAKALADSEGERLTSTGLAIGTPAYMSPEQASAERVDARSDQYSLATMLYEMLAGEPPFTGPTAQAITARRLTEPARPLLAVRSTVPPAVERAVLRALERVPSDRFADVASFAAALRSPVAEPLPRRRDWVRRWGLAVAGLVVLVVGAGWLLLRPRAGARVPDAEVLALYRRGMAGYDRRTPTSVNDAITTFRAAIARDSSYAPAWTGLAKAYTRAEEREFAVPGMGRDSLLQAAVTAVDRALALDSANADAWLTRAIVSLRVDRTDHRPVRRAVEQAIRLDSLLAPAWHVLARVRAEEGDLAGALPAWRRAVQVDPRYTQGLAFLAMAFYWQGQYDSAAVWADSAVSVDPTYLLGRTTAGQVAVERGDFAHGLGAFDAARRLSTDVEVVNALAGTALVEARAGRREGAAALLRRVDSVAAGYDPAPLHTAVYVAQAHAALGEADRAVEWLRRYDNPRDLHFQLHLRCDPPMAPLRSHPGYRALLLGPPPSGKAC